MRRIWRKKKTTAGTTSLTENELHGRGKMVASARFQKYQQTFRRLRRRRPKRTVAVCAVRYYDSTPPAPNPGSQMSFSFPIRNYSRQATIRKRAGWKSRRSLSLRLFLTARESRYWTPRLPIIAPLEWRRAGLSGATRIQWRFCAFLKWVMNRFAFTARAKRFNQLRSPICLFRRTPFLRSDPAFGFVSRFASLRLQ